MIDRDSMEKYLIDKREDIKNIEIRKRNIQLIPTREFIQVVYGPRRAGKSYVFLDMVREMDLETVLYLNFDDIQLEDWTAKDIFDSVSIFEEIFGKEPDTIIFDEPQRIEKWEKAVISLYEKKRFNIFLTGSSSKLLAKEIDTSLRGRSLKQALYPLSFREYLSFKDIKIPSNLGTRNIISIRRALEEYLHKGSFPGIIKEPGLRQRFYGDYLDLVIYRDLVERYGISNLALLKFLIRNIIASYSKELSVNKLHRTWTSMRYEGSKKTLYQYLSHLEDAGFAVLLRKYSRSEKTSDLSIPKVYLPDTGIAVNMTGEQIGREMENAVLLELMRRTSDSSSAKIFYWRSNGYEVDFVVCQNEDPVELIQVTNRLVPNNLKREFTPFGKFPVADPHMKKTIITWTGEEEGPGDVNIRSLWSFLLDM